MRPQTDRDYRQRMLRVLVHIEQHLDDSLALDDLAALAHFSPFHFHRIFRAMIGSRCNSIWAVTIAAAAGAAGETADDPPASGEVRLQSR